MGLDMRRFAARLSRLLWAPLILFLTLLFSACSVAPQAGLSVSSASTLTATAASSATATATFTHTPTRTPTRTPTATATLTPTITPTLPPVAAGTPLPPVSTPIIQAALPEVRILAQWGRGQVNALAWSPDGARLAVSTPLGVYLYSADHLTNPVLIRTATQVGQPVMAYRLAWSPDGRRIAVDSAAAGAGVDTAIPLHQVQVWDVSVTEPQPVALVASGRLALALTFTGADGLALLVSADRGAEFQRWDLRTLTRTRTLPLVGGETAVEGVLSASLERAATRGSNGPVRLWDLTDGTNIATTPETGQDAGPLAFSPDGGLLAVGYPDTKQDALNLNHVTLWRWPQPGDQGVTEALTLADAVHAEGLFEATISLAWSADGQYIAAGFSDHTIHVFNAGNGWLTYRISAESLPAALAFSPPGASPLRLAAGGLELFDMTSGRRTAQDDDYLSGLEDMRFLPDGSALALAGYGLIDFRSTLDGRRVRAITGMAGQVHSLAFNLTGQYMVAGCADGTTRLYQVSDGTYLAELGEPTYPIYAVDFARNNFWIAASGEDSRIRFFRLSDGVLLATQVEPYMAYRLQFSPNSDQIASLTTSGVNLRAITGGEEKMTFAMKGNVGGVGLTDMAYSQGEEYLALVGSGVVRVINPGTLKEVYTIYESGNRLPWSLAFSPDNAFLAVGWSDGQIRLYWAQTGQLMRAWQAHPESVLKLSFTRDGTLLASLGSEGTVRIWGVGGQ